MKVYYNMTKNELMSLSLEEYFQYFNTMLNSDVDLEWLTGIFTELPFQEKKPYLTRRFLVPKDERFKNIEIVYSASAKKLGAVVWDFKITLRELVNLFGRPSIRYEPYSDTFVFMFISKNPDKVVIKTRSSQSLNEKINLKELELGKLDLFSDEVLNIKFEFLQFSLNVSTPFLGRIKNRG